jgi:predicted Zn finger-like uncharacterized protein
MPVKVECESCKAPYTIDERRIPAAGLRVRCPKCAKTFVVKMPGTDTGVGLPAPVEKPQPASKARSATMVGVGFPMPPGARKPAPPPSPQPTPQTTPQEAVPLPVAAPAALASSMPPPNAPQPSEGQESEPFADFDNLPEPVPRAPAIPKIAAPASPPAAPAPPAKPIPVAAMQANAPPPVADLPAVPAAKPGPKPFVAKRTAVGLGGMLQGLPGAQPPAAAPTAVPASPDLPAPRAAVPAPKPFGEVELPSPVARPGGPPRPPPHRPPPPARGQTEDHPAMPRADLPARGQGKAPAPTVRGVPQPRGGSDFGEIDLPTASPAGRDLPARRPAGADLPAPRAGGVDLPAPRAGGVDLPATRTAGGFGEIDLPDLTPGAQRAPGFGSLDLPSVSGAGANLPAIPAAEAHLPSVTMPGAHLPAVTMPGAHLPSVAGPGLPAMGGAGLPSMSGPGAHLPSVASHGGNLPSERSLDPFADLSSPPPMRDPFGGSRDARELAVAQTMAGAGPGVYSPHTAAGGFGELELPGPSPSEAHGASGFGELEGFGEVAPRSAGTPGPSPVDFGDLEIPGPGGGDFGPSPGAQTTGGDQPGVKKRAPSLMLGESRPSASAPPAGSGSVDTGARTGQAGGMGFGEVDLGGGGAGPEDDMEFGAIPQEKGGPPSGPAYGDRAEAPLPKPRSAISEAEAPPRGPSKIGRAALGLLAVALLGGAALEFTTHGAFARNDISDRLNAEKYAAAERTAIKRTRDAFGEDAQNRANDALLEVEKDAAAAPRFTPLLAYAAYANFAHEVRFGKDAQRDARAQALLARVAGTSISKRLAEATRDIVAGQLPPARGVLKEILRSDPKNVDAAVMLGELELRAKMQKDTIAAFEQAKAIQDSARTRAGLMRAYEASGDLDKAKIEAEAIAKKYPNHASSRLLLAKYVWQTEKNEKEALRWLTELQKPNVVAASSVIDQLEGGTLRGMLLLERGRVTEAKAAFEAASLAAKGNPAAGPQLGLGEVNMVSGQYAAAIANFKAASEADPTLTMAKVGIARAQLKLEKPGEAKATLAGLKDPRLAGEIGYWLGQAEEKLAPEKPSEAIKIYEEAVKAQPTEVKPYIALANLQAKAGKTEDADTTIANATKAVPPSEKLFLGIGELRFRQARYPAALDNFNKALEIQPENLEALFAKGRTLLRMDHDSIEKGKEVLDLVEKKDAKYPGLALEMGLYYQETNRINEAIVRYQSALDAAPNDVDVKLQVGRAMVESRDPKAEETIRAVMDKCGSLSAAPDQCTLESKHYLGRALLNKGAFGDAQVYLKQAAEKGDANPSYHLYFGWALVELGRLEDAKKELGRALELDKSMGDAYWLTAEILGKQQLYRESIEQANQALLLSPSRFDAHATIAFSMKGMNNEDGALKEFGVALKADPHNPKAAFWRYTIADIHYHRGTVKAASEDLKECIKVASTYDPKPPWLPKAHFYLAEGLKYGGDKAEAIKEYRAFLDSSRGVMDPARKEAKATLLELGSVYTGD